MYMRVSTHKYISQLYLLSRPRCDDTLVITSMPSPKVIGVSVNETQILMGLTIWILGLVVFVYSSLIQNAFLISLTPQPEIGTPYFHLICYATL